MTKNDVYAEVTDRVISALESGTVPWRKPWQSAGGPVNVRSGKPYRGVNVFLLGLNGHADPRWGTFKAVKEAGGSVRKGEKATRVILWKPVTRKEEASEASETQSSYMLLRQYPVFNAEQCEGLPEREDVKLRAHEVDGNCESIIAGFRESGPGISHGGDRAYYSPSHDRVRMPVPEAFESSASYYSTLFHELVHSTGHESRLARLEPATFGSDPYAREELVAEMGAAMLAGLAGLALDPGEQSAAYIAGWLQRLQDDRRLVVQAAAQAQRAADLVAGNTFEEAQALPLAIAA